MQRRAANVSQILARQSRSPFHPARTHEAAADLTKVWHATCKVSVSNGSGSGFFVNGGRDGTVVVTNAHVVDGHAEAQYKGYIVSARLRLVDDT
jgi:S1-C subfamily serine protease